MKNPKVPSRKIRHAKVMTQAGFKLDERWMSPRNKEKGTNKITDVDKICYWINDEGIRIVCYDFKQMSLKRLVKYVAEQARHIQKKKTRIVYG